MYKNGKEDVVNQLATEEQHAKLANLLQQAMYDGLNGHATFGDGDKIGMYVNLADVTRVKVEVIKEDIQ